MGARMRALGTAAGVALSLYNHPASVAVSTDGTQIAISAHEVIPLSTAELPLASLVTDQC